MNLSITHAARIFGYTQYGGFLHETEYNARRSDFAATKKPLPLTLQQQRFRFLKCMVPTATMNASTTTRGAYLSPEPVVAGAGFGLGFLLGHFKILL